jgi:hypothetical protein
MPFVPHRRTRTRMHRRHDPASPAPWGVGANMGVTIHNPKSRDDVPPCSACHPGERSLVDPARARVSYTGSR